MLCRLSSSPHLFLLCQTTSNLLPLSLSLSLPSSSLIKSWNICIQDSPFHRSSFSAFLYAETLSLSLLILICSSQGYDLIKYKGNPCLGWAGMFFFALPFMYSFLEFSKHSLSCFWVLLILIENAFLEHLKLQDACFLFIASKEITNKLWAYSKKGRNIIFFAFSSERSS